MTEEEYDERGTGSEKEANLPGEEIQEAAHLQEQLGSGGEDEEGLDEALQAWRDGGHDMEDLDDADEIRLVQFPQLEPTGPVTKKEVPPQRLENVLVSVVVELGRREMTVREISKLKEQDVIELTKLAGESFEVRVNGRLFAWGEVVVLADQMAVRITSLINPASSSTSGPPA